MDPLTFPQLMAGLIYLLIGGDILVRGSVALARRLRVPPVFVALSVVAVGTSLPELTVSVRASFSGHPGLILGNVVGSNIANVLLVGGAAAVVYPLRVAGPNTRRTGAAMVVVSLLLTALCGTGSVTVVDGLILLTALVLVLSVTARGAIEAHRAEEPTTPLDWVLGLPSELPMIIILIAVGALALPLGAELLVDSAVTIAEAFGVSETVIGLSIVAIGTSLPEVATAVVAALQRRPRMVAGTIIGSNTFNILAVMGLTASISSEPVQVSSRFLLLDLPVMLVTSIGLVLLAWIRKPIGRGAGFAMVGAYAAYLFALYLAA